ncbi:hypothetical protein Mapa_011090 [Marchantia paleacea]|nr:hypothetical protein Mapa_011090 [Marchantia paleacea]
MIMGGGIQFRCKRRQFARRRSVLATYEQRRLGWGHVIISRGEGRELKYCAVHHLYLSIGYGATSLSGRKDRCREDSRIHSSTQSVD